MKFVVVVVSLALFLFQGSFLHAAQKQETITAYYPVAEGNYNKVSANELSAGKMSVAVNSLPGYVGDMAFKTQTTLLDGTGVLQDGTGTTGELAYYEGPMNAADPTSPAVEEFRFYDGEKWKPMRGSDRKFGPWATTDASGNTFGRNKTYQAAADGFVLAYIYDASSSNEYLDGYVRDTDNFLIDDPADSNSPPAKIFDPGPTGSPAWAASRPDGLLARDGRGPTDTNRYFFIIFPVKKDYYWHVRFWKHGTPWPDSGTVKPTIHWIPFLE